MDIIGLFSLVVTLSKEIPQDSFGFFLKMKKITLLKSSALWEIKITLLVNPPTSVISPT